MAEGAPATPTEALLRRDRWIALAGLIAITLLAWAYLAAGAGTGMSVAMMTTWSLPAPLREGVAGTWEPAYWGVMLAMWWVMMVAMMTPSAAPMVLLYARAARHGQRRGRMAAGPIPTAVFYLGYLAVWLAFSAAATSLQWGLERSGLVDAMTMASISGPLSAGLLVAAGLYQLTALKHACLEHCRAPAEFLSRHWRPGRLGAFRIGIIHGTFCLGCCWVLMALLFVGGTMNLVWIAGLAIIVLAEKLAPFGHRIAQGLGLAMVLAGAWLAVA